MSLKKAKTDSFYCESIAKSISEIIRFSFDEEFRKSCFKLFGVSSTNETEKEISKRLLSIIEDKNTNCLKPRKRRKKLSDEDTENLEEVDSNAEDTNQSTTTNSKNHQISSQIPQNFFQKNWLQISSQQYREAVKRRRLNYFSQPQYSQGEGENAKCDLWFSSSQPSTSGSGFLGESPNQALGNANFCPKMKSNFKFYNHFDF